ncbi:MAG: hypothetical protein JWQ27_3175 [Ferruginibacter sp.]|nr:hypothetical protein [Ferruginibacter sp.]
MKFLPIFIALVFLADQVIAQKQISCLYTAVSKHEINGCKKVPYLVANPQITKQKGKLTIPMPGRAAQILKDDHSDEYFHEFEYLGDLRSTMLSLVKRTDYHHETFYLINRASGRIDTLIGLPVFAGNLRDFACINNPGTDEKQQIQTGTIKNGSVAQVNFIKPLSGIFITGIACVTKNSLLITGDKDDYWKINF